MASNGAISESQFKQILSVTRLLTVTADLDLLLLRIAESASAILNCERASIFMHDPVTDELWTKVALQTREIRVPSSAGIVGHVFKSNTLLHVPEPYQDPRFNPEPDRRNNFLTRNLLTAPMPDLECRPVGVIQAVNKRGGAFDPGDQALLGLLADQAGVAIQRYRLQQAAVDAMALRREMELARAVQQALIPTAAPEMDRIRSGGWNRAASTTGGDAFDLWKTADGRLGIFLGDATGHGIGPALVVSQTRTLVRAMCDIHPDPRQLFACANARLNEDLDAGKFVTAFLGFLSPDGTLDWCSAGHGPIYIRTSPAKPMVEYDSTAPPLGILPQFAADQNPPLRLEPGGFVCVVSDGISEAFAPDGEQYGNDRLSHLLVAAATEPPEEVLRRIQADIDVWQQGHEPKDDQTVVMARFDA